MDVVLVSILTSLQPWLNQVVLQVTQIWYLDQYVYKDMKSVI